MARPFTRKLIELVDLEIVAARAALIACLSFMSESDIEDMMVINGWHEDGEEV